MILGKYLPGEMLTDIRVLADPFLCALTNINNHHDGDCANTRTERKASNREHLRAFSFYFCTFKYCNPTPPFAYYKRGGRDPRQEEMKNGETNTQQWQYTKHTLKHTNTPTHRDLGAIPLSTSLYSPTTSTLVQSNTSSSEH
jgi:hypothetical protein